MEISSNFGTDVCGKQSPNIRHAYLRLACRYCSEKFPDQHLRVLEIGSWVGASTITLAKELSNCVGNRFTVHCVDPWIPYFNSPLDADEHYRVMDELCRKGVAFETFQQNLEAAGVSSQVTIHKGLSEIVLPIFANQSFHLIYIDGAHDFPHVNFDIVEAKRLVLSGGIIVGDDLEKELKDVDRDFHGLAVKQNRDFVKDPSSGQGYHPGVTQAVSDNFELVFVADGLWAVEYENGVYKVPTLRGDQSLVPDHLPPEVSPPELMMDTLGFNIVKFRGRFYGIRQSLGPVDLELPDKKLLEKYDKKDFLIDDDCSRLKDKIVAEIEGRGRRFWPSFFESRD